jgi:hypothetical protein
MSGSRRWIYGAVLGLAAVTAGRVEAAFILDQSALPPMGGFGTEFHLNGSIDEAQTFQVGITGSLGIVDFLLSRDSAAITGTCVFDIRPVVSNGRAQATWPPQEANSPVLVTASIAASTIPVANPAFVQVDFSASPIQVTAGEELAIVLRAPGVNGFIEWWGQAGGSVYPNGNLFQRAPNLGVNTWTIDPGGPSTATGGFETFVQPAVVVPEPSSFVLSWSAALVGVVLAWSGHRIRYRAA